MKRTKALKKQATDDLKKTYKISYFIFINLKTPSDKTYFDIYKIQVTELRKNDKKYFLNIKIPNEIVA